MGSIDDFSELCRLCLVKDQVNIPIFDETSDIGQTFLKIESCLPVKVSRDDNLPKKICDGCSYKLDMLYIFRNTSIDSEKQLISWLSQAGLSTTSKDPLATTTKPEIMVKQETFEPSDTRVDGDSSDLGVDAHSYMMQQQQLPYQQDFDFGEPSSSAARLSDEPSPKRAKRAAALKKAPIEETEEDEEEDLDAAMQITKAEDEDSEDADQPDYVEAPSTSADDQPGPSGVGKGAVEAPWNGQILFIAENGKKLHTCVDCNMIFIDYSLLTRHRREVHPPPTPQCPICDRTFKRKDALKNHMETHDDKDKYICDHCHTPLKSKNQLQTHKFLHSLEGQKCPDCDLIYNFKSVDSFYTHRELHSNENFMCEDCGLSFQRKSQFRDHRRRKHLQTNFPCKECDKVFKTLFGLTQHKEIKHLGITHVCELCGKELATPQSLKNHLRVHTGEKPIICTICGIKLATNKVLKDHMMRHSNERPYKCQHCDKGFRTSSDLSLHRRRLHEAVGRIQCGICDKSFAIPSHLKRHQKQAHNFCDS